MDGTLSVVESIASGDHVEGMLNNVDGLSVGVGVQCIYVDDAVS